MDTTLTAEYLDVLRAKYPLEFTQHGIQLYELLVAIHNSEGDDDASMQPSTSEPSVFHRAAAMEKAADKWRKYKRSTPDLAEDTTNFHIAPHPKRCGLTTPYVKTMAGVRILLSKCRNGNLFLL